MKSQKGFIAPLLLILVAVLLLGGGAYEYIYTHPADPLMSDAKTYSNGNLKFSLRYPSIFYLNSYENDQYNRYAFFLSSDSATSSNFSVRLMKDTAPDLGVKYGSRDSEIVSTNVPIAGTTGSESVSKNGYSDAGGKMPPFVEFYVRHDGDLYILAFNGDSILSPWESKILKSFKFTEPGAATTCGPTEYSCPCATGNYCAGGGATCLTPTSVCPVQ